MFSNVTYVSLSSQVAVRTQLDVIANNVANMNTAGYKANTMLFESAMEKVSRAKDGRVDFVMDRLTYSDFSDGGARKTDNPLDIAIDGEGFFQVMTEDGPRYTRDGRLARDVDGRLVSLAGHPVTTEAGNEIMVPDDAAWIEIGIDGSVVADGEDLGRIGVFAANEPELMSRDGGLLYAAGDAVLEAQAQPRVLQGMVEDSNVNPILEMTRLIDVNRSYAMAEKLGENAHELSKNAVGRIGRTA